MKKKGLNQLLAEPKLVRLISHSIVSMQLTLPSGALLKLGQGQSYTTGDQKDLEFLSQQKGLAIMSVNDAEYRRHYVKLFQELPNVYNQEMPVEEVQHFRWTTEEEQLVVEELRKRGYDIKPTSIPTEKAYAPLGDDKVKVANKVVSPTPKKKPTSFKGERMEATRNNKK